MNEFYEWLYTHFAHPRIDEDELSISYQAIKADWMKVLDSISTHERIVSEDMVCCLKEAWGTQAFAYGVQVGMMLVDGLPEKENLME